METVSSATATHWREGRRLRALELHHKGWVQSKIAEALGVTHGAVSQWLARARQGERRRRGIALLSDQFPA